MDAVYACDAMIWSSPTYHGSVSGSFKNALDRLTLLAERDPPYLANKPVGLVTTAGGVQGLQAINSMEFIVRALRGWSVPLVQPVAQSWRSFDRDGRLADDAVADQLRALGAEGVVPGEQHRGHLVDPPVRGPDGQDRRDQQLERRGEIQLDTRIGVQPGQLTVDPARSPYQRGPR